MVKHPPTANRFDESADQVKKLLDRDRKEVQEFGDIGGAFKAEFDEGQDDAPTTAGQPTSKPPGSQRVETTYAHTQYATAFAAAKPASPFGGAAPAASPFGAAPSASPFGAQRKLMEPEGLSPTMPAMPVSKDPWWKKITLTQVVRNTNNAPLTTHPPPVPHR